MFGSSLKSAIIAGVVAVVGLVACTVAEPGMSEADSTKKGGSSSSGGDGDSRTPEEGGLDDEGNPLPTKTGLPCEVDAILKTKCQTCHASEPKYGASTALVTFDDLMKTHGSKKVYELMKDRVHDANRPMPPSPQPRLGDADLGAIDTWIEGGAKKSDATCENRPAPPPVQQLSCKPDTVLKATKPFEMKAGTPLDQYQCFGVDQTLAKKRHVIGLAPKVDNKQIVHHILLFQTQTAESTEPFACEAFGSAAWKLVAGWAPGGNNLELPPEAGFPAEAGTTHWVLQIHYNNATAKTGLDNSGYELCTTEDLRPNDAGVLAFGSIKFNIPPRKTAHTIRCDYKLGNQFNGVKMFNASPHMHTRGLAMSTEKLAGGTGAPEKVFEQNNFSFEAQANYPINASVQQGDVMRTRCKWNNPTDQTIGFGEGTGDEMCFDFIGYYPNIPDRTLLGLPLFTWVTPSQGAQCVEE